MIRKNIYMSFSFSFIKVNVSFYQITELLIFFSVFRTIMDEDKQAIVVGLGAGLGGFIGLVCIFIKHK